MIKRAAGLAAGALLLAGCPDKPMETGTDTAAGSGSDTDAATTATDGVVTGEMSSTSDGGGTMGGTMGGSTTDKPETTGMTATGTTTDATTGMTSGTSSETTGGVTPGVLESCEAACAKFFDCPVPPIFPDLETCVQACVDDVTDDEMCVQASIEFNQCLASFTCEELADVLNNEDLGKCADESMAVDAACQECEGFGSVGPDGCSLGEQCPDQPLFEYSCEGDTCRCLVDGVPTGMMCPAKGFCELEYADQQQAAFDCCGFDI